MSNNKKIYKCPKCKSKVQVLLIEHVNQTVIYDNPCIDDKGRIYLDWEHKDIEDSEVVSTNTNYINSRCLKCDYEQELDYDKCYFE